MKKTLFLLLIILSLSACRKKNAKPNWDVDLLVPLLSTTLDINNLIADSLLKTNPDQSLTLVYNNSIFSLKLDSLVKIPDTTIQETYLWLFGNLQLLPGQSLTPLFPKSEETKYDLKDVELNKVIIRSGSVTIEVKNPLDQPLQVFYKIPSAVKGNDTLSVTERVNANSTLNKTYDLSGYTLNLKGSQQNDFNTIVTFIDATIHPDGDTANISIGDEFIIKNSFTNLVPEYARGYFGQSNFTVDPTTEATDFFRKITGGTLDIDSVDMTFTIRNEVGIDLQTVINTLKSINTVNSTTVSLQHAVIGSSINITRAVESPSSTPPYIYTDYPMTFNNGNSNVDVFIENLPDMLEYSLDMTVNPLGNVSGGNDFVFYGTGVDFMLDLELPLSIIANNLSLEDTADFDLGEKDEDETFIVDGFLYLYADNGFPLAATAQLYLMDSAYSILDSLIAGGALIEAATVDFNLRVTEKKRSVIAIPINKDIIDQMYVADYVLVKVAFTTTAQPKHVKIYSDYVMELKLIGDFTYNIELK